MKKKVGLIVLSIIIVLSFLVLKFNEDSKTIEEAITSPGSMPISIIHEEETDKGSIVFCNIVGKDGLYVAVVRKSIFGFKTVYSGAHGDIKLAAKKFGLTHSYYPNIEKTSLPIYFGVIGNPDISEVKIVEKKRNIEDEAKIINTNGIRIWLVYMKKFQGSDFNIIGISADGKELTKINGNISPYYAEQKPFKGYE
ncbi:hypothetical protein HNQ80_004301 [Anaerosolibacter carboniphilus]|uniref:Uncharacterized protein n=1 Tax=Anaerosolibacter carboniphilus TaxID=1417629 RepID=A0A841KXJ1_9FIRM|nr:hypothetical protein [Anaerosolibacter carboniphilus]MBB6218161.1 hypothetical protein [Anaerosolibacter carboniphilus]